MSDSAPGVGAAATGRDSRPLWGVGRACRRGPVPVPVGEHGRLCGRPCRCSFSITSRSRGRISVRANRFR